MSDQDPREREAEVAHLLVETGVALGQCSYPSPQAEELVSDVARAYGSVAEVAVLPTMVIAEDRSLATVAMERIGSAYRFDQMSHVQTAVTDARFARVDAATALARLRGIADHPPANPAWLRVVGYALSAAGFALCLRLGTVAVVAAATLGALVGAALILAGSSGHLAALMPIAATFCSALAVTAGASQLGVPIPVRLAAVPVLMLLPGAALTAAVIELVSGDMISGASRLIYAVMLLVAMAISFSLAVQIADFHRIRLTDFTLTTVPAWAVWFGVALFAVGTMLYFCTPRLFWIPTILIAYLAFAVQAAASFIVSQSLAAGVATAVALIAAWGYNRRQAGGPAALVIYLPAFWLLVPGSSGFVALTGVMDKDAGLAAIGLQTGTTIVAMAIGMMVAVLAAPMVVRLGNLARRGKG